MKDFNEAARVAAGAAWLDENRPGWERMIDLAKLNMPDSEWCICGQAEAWSIQSSELAAARGFFHSFSMTPLPWDEYRVLVVDEYVSLDVAWRSLIKERFDSGLLSDERDPS